MRENGPHIPFFQVMSGMKGNTMRAILWLMTMLEGRKQRKRARHVVRACVEAQMKKLLDLTPGMPDAERAESLKTDDDVTSTILNAFPNQDADAEAMSASFHVLEKLRVAEASDLKPLDQQYASQ